MPGFRNLREVADSIAAGRRLLTSFRKQPTATVVAGCWQDLAMSPGNPVPFYYASAPMVAKPIARSTDYGLNHGPPVSPASKHVKRFLVYSSGATAAPCVFTLCDYLLYYPFIDMSAGGDELQPMDNTVGLTRFMDGAGVQMMAVEVASQIGSSEFRVQYTNQNGDTGRLTPRVRCNTQTPNGTIITTGTGVNSAGPFLPLQAGDTGVRAVEGVAFKGAGDVGLITLVLVMPILTVQLYERASPVEKDFTQEQPLLPIIADDAYLNLLCHVNGSISGAPIFGLLETVWGAS